MDDHQVINSSFASFTFAINKSIISLTYKYDVL